MKLHCDICDKPLGNYLYGIGGVEEVAHIGLPDITCNECWISRNKRKYLHTIL